MKQQGHQPLVGQTCSSGSQGTTQEELGQQLATAGWDRLREGNPSSLQWDKGLGESQVPESAPVHTKIGEPLSGGWGVWCLPSVPAPQTLHLLAGSTRLATGAGTLPRWANQSNPPQAHMTQAEPIRAFPRIILTGVVREEPCFHAVP